jgi:hypothetical protein
MLNGWADKQWKRQCIANANQVAETGDVFVLATMNLVMKNADALNVIIRLMEWISIIFQFALFKTLKNIKICWKMNWQRNMNFPAVARR